MTMHHSSNILYTSIGVGALGIALFCAASKCQFVRRQLVRLGICSLNPVADGLEPPMRRVARGLESLNILSVDDLSTQQIRCIMERVKRHVGIPLINAGDGSGEHPSQALLDLYTISNYFPVLDTEVTDRTFTICFVGDLKNGRTAHSLAKLLSRFNVVMRYVAPSQLQMPTEIQREVEKNFAKYNIPDLPVSRQTSFSDIDDGCEGCDVIYVTRLQKERMDADDYEKYKHSYQLSRALVTKLPQHVKIMHPLPRLDELPTEIDNDGRAIYFEQARNGLYVRMAMLYLILNSTK